jgi:hypothetical protein
MRYACPAKNVTPLQHPPSLDVEIMCAGAGCYVRPSQSAIWRTPSTRILVDAEVASLLSLTNFLSLTHLPSLQVTQLLFKTFCGRLIQTVSTSTCFDVPHTIQRHLPIYICCHQLSRRAEKAGRCMKHASAFSFAQTAKLRRKCYAIAREPSLVCARL